MTVSEGKGTASRTGACYVTAVLLLAEIYVLMIMLPQRFCVSPECINHTHKFELMITLYLAVNQMVVVYIGTVCGNYTRPLNVFHYAVCIFGVGTVVMVNVQYFYFTQPPSLTLQTTLTIVTILSWAMILLRIGLSRFSPGGNTEPALKVSVEYGYAGGDGEDNTASHQGIDYYGKTPNGNHPADVVEACLVEVL